MPSIPLLVRGVYKTYDFCLIFVLVGTCFLFLLLPFIFSLGNGNKKTKPLLRRSSIVESRKRNAGVKRGDGVSVILLSHHPFSFLISKKNERVNKKTKINTSQK